MPIHAEMKCQAGIGSVNPASDPSGSVLIQLPICLKKISLKVCFHENFVHKEWIVEMAGAYESHCLAAPLSHGAGGENARRPEDKAFQSFASDSNTVLVEHAGSPVLMTGKAAELSIVSQGIDG